MTDHQHAATGPGPGSGPRPTPGAGPQEAAPAADAAGTPEEEPRAYEKGTAQAPGATPAAGASGPTAAAGADGTADVPEAGGPATATGSSGPTATAEPGATAAAAAAADGPAPATGVSDEAPPADVPGSGNVPGSADAPGPAHTPGPTDAPAPADVPGPPHRFRRDRRHKMLAGVCSGLGRQCDMDPVIFRITLAVLSATGGLGLLFYGFAWLFVPYDDEDQNEVRKLLTGRVDGQALTAVLFALVGSGVFLTLLNNGGVLAFAVVLSLLLAGAGYWSRHRTTPDPDPLAAQAVADAPPEAQAPPVPAAYSSWWRDPIVKDGTHEGGTGYLWGPRDSRARDIAAAVNIGLGPPGSPDDLRRRTPAQAPRPRGGPRWIGGWVFVLALVAGGLGTRLTWDEHPLGSSLQTGLSCALIVLGTGIAVSAFLGRTGTGSIFLAVITAALLAASAAIPKDISTQWMRETWRPTAVADVPEQYELGTGVGTLDLTRVPLTKGQTLDTGADVGVGRLKVIVPKDVTVKMTIDVGVGDIQLPGDEQRDVDVEPGRHKELTLAPPSGTKSTGTLDLDLRVGVGQAEVSRAAS
ncbi:PspC domain-containing protein [Streptomyces sp. GESEQ-35]|uniref:PspC domain-containing protein n=1 Tax=Streptomyces sp. GESEQ-35 TaxID=2812657 RepID=UPI001FF3A37A|nr:PspC domain-containing protein [Streptomyces sp. GESEQ-35]